MLPNTKLSQIPSKLLPPPTTTPEATWPGRNTQPTLPRNGQMLRRQLMNSSMLLLVGSHSLSPSSNLSKAQAQETAPGNSLNTPNCGNKVLTKKAFIDISIDGESAGRIVIGLYGDDVPAGTSRFSSLISGQAGISYRRKEFIKIMPHYVQHGGIRSYGADADRAGGSLGKLENLVYEWQGAQESCDKVKNLAGTVGIVVRDPHKPPPKIKLVARGGKLVIDQEEVGVGPNGTEFVISVKDSPEIDDSVLVVGRVLEGIEVVERIGKVKTVQENTGSPYFRVAKLIGDKRAVVAERGFNRPYSKVVVTDCGLMD